MEYYALFQRYLHLYEVKLSKYIESLNCSVEEFYDELAAIKDDESIKDKKLLHFVNYLVACTDYPSFYKVMYRAAKKATAAQADSKAEGKEDDSADNSSGAKAESKGESKMADCK